MLVHLACFYLSDRGVLQNEAVLPDFPIRQQQQLLTNFTQKEQIQLSVWTAA